MHALCNFIEMIFIPTLKDGEEDKLRDDGGQASNLHHHSASQEGRQIIQN